tara:strand:+ start:383 stop:562 length:180 start_codon:yes stop_codon:yes gene_type:complete
LIDFYKSHLGILVQKNKREIIRILHDLSGLIILFVKSMKKKIITGEKEFLKDNLKGPLY